MRLIDEINRESGFLVVAPTRRYPKAARRDSGDITLSRSVFGLGADSRLLADVLICASQCSRVLGWRY